ncbi:MAG: methylthioadenosine phosphorylase [Elusimicrobia bacterium RIFCSPLOWO2_01_FULL_54_10]|nr:MAG: methylthioadenosine phosphorylase [Elusimicrobia bacterium RIFCSPLOWO2_01_FULL_54_10]
MTAQVGVIGGSGVYEIEGIKGLREVKIKTPFGNPSDSLMVGNLEGVSVAFLPRHARGHKILPSELNSRANIWALKSIGVEKILAVSACGSLKEELPPRHFVIPDQLFDRTKWRPGMSFYGEGIVGHTQFANPYCAGVSRAVFDAGQSMSLPMHLGGTFVIIDGPMFSTKAESKAWRSLGFSIIGMTNLPEARLAREAEICYMTVGLVTDYDVWKEGEEVSTAHVLETIHQNVANVKNLVKRAIPKIAAVERNCECATAAQWEVMTAPSAMNKKTLKKLDLIIGKYVKKK